MCFHSQLNKVLILRSVIYAGCEFILEHGAMANKNVRHFKGSSVLTLVVSRLESRQTSKIIEILLSYGAIVNYEVLIITAKNKKFSKDQTLEIL